MDFDLNYPVYFDTTGTISFKYRKDTIGDEDNVYGVFKFIIDDQVVLTDRDVGKSDWQVKVFEHITPGFHMMKWRYSKLNIIPFTEFMESEIEVITVRGRHSDKLTQCYPCRMGRSSIAADKCELCPKNSYFYINEQNHDYFCAQCPDGTFSAEGSVGIDMCHPKRPCDQGDLDLHYSSCDGEGQRMLTYHWADHDGDGEKDCDPNHEQSEISVLPEPQQKPCQDCTRGMSRDGNGNC